MSEGPRSNLAQEVRRRLEDEINNGSLMPGDALDERQLAKRFQVSRTPIREAIFQLAAQGLVRAIPRQGVYVARMSLKELLAMFELQAELEGICARYAARRMTAEQRSVLKGIYERQRECIERRDSTQYAQENADFHEVIYRGSHNRYLAEQARLIRRRTEIYRQNTFQREGRLAESWDEHGGVVEAILAGNGDAAYRAMRDHISIGGHGFAEFVSTIPDQMLESHEQAYPHARDPEPKDEAPGAGSATADAPAARRRGTRASKTAV
jgi:DNA-binding GntR family transcriptional regulator